MSIGEEMSKADVENTLMTFHCVRTGGPKEKRLRRVELMGEHTPKPLHWLKVTQTDMSTIVSIENLLETFESLADVGDIYRPQNPETNQPREFVLVGYYSLQNIEPAVKRFNKSEVGGIEIVVEAAPHWFMGLYPKGGKTPIGGL